MVLLLFASQQSQLHAFEAALISGLVIGVFGHIIRSRTLILTGILIVGLASTYFLFVVARVS